MPEVEHDALTDEEMVAYVRAVRVGQVARILDRDLGIGEGRGLEVAWGLNEIGLLATPEAEDAIEVQWAVDLGFATPQVENEAAAHRWVQSYIDHPEAMDEGDQMPVALRRIVTTTPWERVTQDGGAHD